LGAVVAELAEGYFPGEVAYEDAAALCCVFAWKGERVLGGGGGG